MQRVYILGNAERYRNYRHAVETAGGLVQFGGEPQNCDALLLPGGGDIEPWRYGQENTASRNLEPERDAREMELLEQFIARKRPVLGICKGFQIINVFFGGTLIQDFPGHHAVAGVDRYHRVRSVSAELTYACGEGCIVNSAHHQIVDRIGKGLRVLQWAPDGVVEAFSHKDMPVWGMQWHPERLKGEVGNSVFRAFLKLI